MTPTDPSRSVTVPVATPLLTIQLGWVRVEGLWEQTAPQSFRWLERRTTKARWGPVAPAQRLIWRDKEL